ncbi:MAG: GPR1/FUN34/YaaH family transporter [Elusimicrobiales bacterium]
MTTNQHTHAATPFANATPLGLIGLAVGCAALTPIAFGYRLTPEGIRTAAMFCLFFGCFGQLVSGIVNLANRNLYGGTLFTAFSFNWAMNYWSLTEAARGGRIDPVIVTAVDVSFLLIFAAVTYGFGFYSKILFYFLLDIDLLYVTRILKDIFPASSYPVLHASVFTPCTGVFTALLGGISLWMAAAELVNPAAGKTVFSMPGPMNYALKTRTETSLAQAEEAAATR